MNVDSNLFENCYDQILKAQVKDKLYLNWLLAKAVIKQESRFNPVANSPAGARGLMQLMPATDEWLDKESDGFDIYGNIKDGCDYLERLHLIWNQKGFDGELLTKLVLASYNAGQGNIGKLVDYCESREIPRNWESMAVYLHLFTGKHSKETLDYVHFVFAFFTDYQNKGGKA